MTFVPTRSAGLDLLSDFVPRAADYARLRNFDLPDHPHVSGLSPYVRHRLIGEDEILQAITARYAPSVVEKFVQEVFWRTYWKGWMQQRPEVWAGYNRDLRQAWDRVQTSAGLRSDWAAACKGQTGIACFDHWAQELVRTGYLHNHARMWFASIWMYTLELPMELGADFFLRHLLDGDPASNTLGWRWVAGLHTPGKTYLARADNIAKYTQRKFDPVGQLATAAMPIAGAPNPARQPISPEESPDPKLRTGVLLTHEDCAPQGLDCIEAVAFARLEPESTTAILHMAPKVTDFRIKAMDDAVTRWPDAPSFNPLINVAEIVDWAESSGLQQIVMAEAPVGPVADVVADAQRFLSQRNIRIIGLRRPYDARAWPFATAGFFKFKAHIPDLLRSLDSRQMSLGL